MKIKPKNTNNWELIRESDGLTKQSKEVRWLEWDENAKLKGIFYIPKVGLSLIMSPLNPSFTWQTTEIIEIIEDKDNYIKFKTKNSTYTLFRI